MPVRESSEAQRRAVSKHDAEVVDKVTVRLPKGTKERIADTGMTVNAYVIEAVLEKLKRDEAEEAAEALSCGPNKAVDKKKS